MSGNTAGWPEVFDHLFPMKLYWGFWFTAVSLDVWEKLDPAVQDFILAELVQFNEDTWRVSGEETQDGINCNTGKEPCKYGVMSNMTHVPVEDEDIALLNEWNKEFAKMWVEQVGVDAAKEWNATAGKALGKSIPVN